MPKRLNSYEKQCLQEMAVAACHAARLRAGTGGICTICGTDLSPDLTRSKTVRGTAKNATETLTEPEVSRLYVIKREVGRGFAITMKDLQFLVEVIERCGL